MLLTEYNEAEQMELFREEGRAEGREEGRAEGREEGRVEGREEGRVEGAERERVNSIRSMMEALAMTAKQAMDVLKIPDSEQPKYLSML